MAETSLSGAEESRSQEDTTEAARRVVEATDDGDTGSVFDGMTMEDITQISSNASGGFDIDGGVDELGPGESYPIRPVRAPSYDLLKKPEHV